MTAGYRDLRISLDARINPPVTPALCRKDDPDFSQTLFYDVPATGIGYFSGPKDYGNFVVGDERRRGCKSYRGGA